MGKRTLLELALFAALTAACSDPGPISTPDKEVCLMRRDGMRYCIEVFEATRRDAKADSQGGDTKSAPRSLEGLVPWSMVSWDAALGACKAKNKRLCESDEWIDACGGVVGGTGTKYTYGDMIDDPMSAHPHCNVNGSGPAPTGSFGGCHSSVGTFDQSGNLWEWTGNARSVAAVRGGGYRSDVVHACKDTTQAFDPESESAEVGFRCCRSI